MAVEEIANGHEQEILRAPVQPKGTALRYQTFNCPVCGRSVAFADRFCSVCAVYIPEGVTVALPCETRTALWESIISRQDDEECLPHADGVVVWERFVENEELLHDALDELPEHETFVEGTIAYEYTLPATARLNAAPKVQRPRSHTDAEPNRAKLEDVARWLDDKALQDALYNSPVPDGDDFDFDADADHLVDVLRPPVHRNRRPAHYWPDFLRDDYVVEPPGPPVVAHAPTLLERAEAARASRAERLERAEAVLKKMRVRLAGQVATLNWLTKRIGVAGRGWKNDTILSKARKTQRRHFIKWVRSLPIVPPDPANWYYPVTPEACRGDAKIHATLSTAEAMGAAIEYVCASIRRLRQTEPKTARDFAKDPMGSRPRGSNLG